MKNFLQSWLSRSNKKVEDTDNSICFTVDKNNNVKINLMFADNSPAAAVNMGKFLHELNSGSMSQSIIDLMIDLGKDNTNYQIFIKHSIMSWFNQIPTMTTDQNNQDQDKPLVKPSEFNTSFKGS